MSGFTPGPWKADGAVVVRETDEDPLAEVYGHGDYEDPDNVAANARLIAAAPELYEACRYIVEAAENGDEMTAIELASAALAKARGEQVSA